MIRHLKGLLHPVMCAVVPMMCAMSAANEVIFRKRATNHRAILRKITSKDKASYGSSPIGCLWAKTRAKNGENAFLLRVASVAKRKCDL